MTENNFNNQQMICFCTGTSKAKIAELVGQGMNTVEQIINETGATTGCGGCDYMLNQFIQELCSPLETGDSNSLF
jgi:bacterioferritin-associated ferredoxin